MSIISSRFGRCLFAAGFVAPQSRTLGDAPSPRLAGNENTLSETGKLIIGASLRIRIVKRIDGFYKNLCYI